MQPVPLAVSIQFFRVISHLALDWRPAVPDLEILPRFVPDRIVGAKSAHQFGVLRNRCFDFS